MPKVIGLIGSPKGARSNSKEIADYLLGKLTDQGFETEMVSVYSEHRRDPEFKRVIEKLNDADLVTLVFPLYIDSLPARLIRLLELVYMNRRENKKDRRFIAICQSGFPEQHQNHLALEMCRKFAEMSDFRWAGGIPIGAGSIVGEQDLVEAKGRVYFIRNALDMAVEAIIGNEEIPEEVAVAASKLPVPAWLYRLIGNSSWKQRAKQNGLRKRDLFASPYETTREGRIRK